MDYFSGAQCALYPDKLYEFLDNGSYLDFLKRVSTDSEVIYISLTFPIEAIDPLACLEILGRENEFQYFWEIPQQELSISAGRELVSIKADGVSRFEQINDQINTIKTQTSEFSAVSHRYSGLNFLGGFSFYEQNEDPVWKSFNAASFSVPEWVVIREGKLGLLTVTLNISRLTSADQINRIVQTKLQPFSKIFSLNSKDILKNLTHKPGSVSLSLHQPPSAYDRWIKSVKRAKKYISHKYFDKIVLAREFVVDTKRRLAPTHIIHDLRQQYPNCYTFLIGKQGEKTFVGCSPERLAAFRKHFLLTEALAGSIRRGPTAAEDAVLAKQLLNSTKNTSEHHFVIKAIEQKLKSFALSMDRDTNPCIKKFMNVQHLFTPITARLRENADCFSILKALHPTPAVGGYPWEKAAEYLYELEYFDRGWYAGPVGWLNSKGDGEFTVAIRSGLIQDTVARFYAGCGIVADSSPDAEWRETNLKLMPMLSALRYD